MKAFFEGFKGGSRSKGMVHIPIKSFIFLPVFMFFVTACASQKDIIYLNNQVNALYRQTKKHEKGFEQSIQKLDEKIKASETESQIIERIEKTLKEDQESIGLNMAQLGAELVEMRSTVQTLSGRIEENSNLLKRTVEGDTTQKDALVSQMNEHSRMLKDLKTSVERLESYLHSETAPKKEKPPVVTVIPAGEVVQTESGLYEKTLAHYREGRYEEALAGFNNFIKLYPKSDLADNAQFWIGECHRSSRNYEEAILAYQKVVNGYPKGNKVPAAMLQQAFAFEKLNDKTTANLVFKKLIKSFPTTKEAKIAKKRLKKR